MNESVKALVAKEVARLEREIKFGETELSIAKEGASNLEGHISALKARLADLKNEGDAPAPAISAGTQAFRDRPAREIV